MKHRICIGLLVLFACTSEKDDETGRPALEDLNIVLIVIDTLGAEHMGCLNPGLTNTPNMDELASRGVSFTHAYSPVSWTQPSVASLFTSTMPSKHGVMLIFDSLGEENRTLAELLKKRGFTTGGVISHFLIDEKYGFHQGFDLYDTSPVGGHQAITSDKVTDAALDQLDHFGDELFFLFVHYFDPHSPYHHHPDFNLTSGYKGSLKPAMAWNKIMKMKDDLKQDDLEYLRGLYREEIAFTDFHVGRLLHGLAELGKEENTLVILTADHGEEFMQHGDLGHNRTLYDELLRVPLIFSLPGHLAPRTLDGPVSTLDVLPTLITLSRGIKDNGPWMGRSLVDALFESRDSPADRPFFAEVCFDENPSALTDPAMVRRFFRTALYTGGLKLIHNLKGGRFEFYDRNADPGEQNNLWLEGHPALEGFTQRLQAWEKEHVDPWKPNTIDRSKVDPELIERARALGYIK